MAVVGLVVQEGEAGRGAGQQGEGAVVGQEAVPAQDTVAVGFGERVAHVGIRRADRFGPERRAEQSGRLDQVQRAAGP